MQKHRVSALQPLIRVVDGAGAPYFSTLLLGSGSRLQFYDSYLDSFSADIPPFPVVESYDSGDVKGGGAHCPKLYAFPVLQSYGVMAVERQEYSSLFDC